MPDDQSPDPPEDDGSAVQPALGERRRRRVAERAGQVDLDADTAQWPVTDPPTIPRPVVRPARPTVEGAATAPVLPPPGQTVVGPLLEARRAEVGDEAPEPSPGGRRSRPPEPVSSAPRQQEPSTVAGGGGLPGRLSWPPGRREIAIAAGVVAGVVLLVVLLTSLLGGGDGGSEASAPTHVVVLVLDPDPNPGTPETPTSQAPPTPGDRP